MRSLFQFFDLTLQIYVGVHDPFIILSNSQNYGEIWPLRIPVG